MKSPQKPSPATSPTPSYLLFLALVFLLVLNGVFCERRVQLVSQSGETHPLTYRHFKLSVGRLFTLSTGKDHFVDEEMLPSWCRFNTSAELIYGIPQLEDLGVHLIFVHDMQIEVTVVEEGQNNCGEETTSWLEVIDEQPLGNASTAQQFGAIQTLTKLLAEMDIQMSDWRVFPASYLERYRTVLEMISEPKQPKADQMVLVLNVSCGELDETATEIISAMADSRMGFQVVEGRLNPNREPIVKLESTTQSSSNMDTRRTTRRVHDFIDNPPAMLNRLKTYTCKKGILCRLQIPENTFVDAEDGPTSRLNLSVQSIHEGQSNFLVAVPGSNLLEGVPIESSSEKAVLNGDTFDFRLEARDRNGQVASAPFQVIVQDSLFGERPNHQYAMLMDTALERFRTQPQTPRDFIYRLTASLKRVPLPKQGATIGVDLWEVTTEIRVEELVDNGPGQTILKWSNTSLSRKSCQEAQINATRDLMIHAGSGRTRHEFTRLMGAQFHVRRVTVELQSACLLRTILSPSFRFRATTTERNVPDTSKDNGDSLLNSIIVPIILLVVIFILLSILVLLCMAHHKRQYKIKHNDFTTKGGRPVVFPEEVPHCDGDSSPDGSMATVTTPMLVDREQPPLDPTKMTLHENPLYRPPPQIQANLVKTSPELSPRQSLMPANHSTTTFNPATPMKAMDASPTPIRNNPFLYEQQRSFYQDLGFRAANNGTPRRTAPATVVGQRRPPPYMAA